MEAKQKKEVIKKIKTVWAKCEYLLNNRTWTLYGKELLSLTRDESKRHDNFRGHNARGLTITEESKFFAVQRLAEYLYLEDLEGVFIPSLDDYHTMQKSCFMAYSLAITYSKELKEIISLEDAMFFNSLDYCEFIKVE